MMNLDIKDMGLTYKNHSITPQIVCFNIMYFVCGDVVTYGHYKDIDIAKKEIDIAIAKEYINEKLTKASEEIGVSKETLKIALRDVLVGND